MPGNLFNVTAGPVSMRLAELRLHVKMDYRYCASTIERAMLVSSRTEEIIVEAVAHTLEVD